MKSKSLVAAVLCGWVLSSPAVPSTQVNAAPARGWLSWRGPDQNGASREIGLPEKLSVEQALWTAEFPGASTPVIANGKLYVMGFIENTYTPEQLKAAQSRKDTNEEAYISRYLGKSPDLQEGVACFDAETGQKLWQQ